MPVVVVGSINLDLTVRGERLPRAGQTVLGHDLTCTLGGKGANQALAARAAGASVHLVAAVGDDQAGRWALGALSAQGIDTTWVLATAGPTGTALIAVEEASGDNQIMVASGANLELSVAQVLRALDAVAGAHGALAVLVNFEVAAAVVEAACSVASAHGWPLVVNPAPARPFPTASLGRSAVLTPNRHEVRELFGAASVGAANIIKALDDGLGAVLVTLGPDGADLHEPGQTLRVPAPSVRALDTTGAGDVLNGTLAASLASGEPIGPAAARAVAAASRAVCSGVGRTHWINGSKGTQS